MSRFSPLSIEIREPDGELDEVCADATGVHLERMSDQSVWLKVGDVVVNLFVEKGKLKMFAEIDE